jgi:hypothetical protein
MHKITKNDNEYIWPGYSTVAQIINLGYSYEPLNNQAEGIYRDIHSPLPCINAIGGHQHHDHESSANQITALSRFTNFSRTCDMTVSLLYVLEIPVQQRFLHLLHLIIPPIQHRNCHQVDSSNIFSYNSEKYLKLVYFVCAFAASKNKKIKNKNGGIRGSKYSFNFDETITSKGAIDDIR